MGMAECVVQVGVLRLPRDRLQAVLTTALARDWTPRQAAILACTAGVETVRQAVQRTALPSQVWPCCRACSQPHPSACPQGGHCSAQCAF